MSPRVLSVLGGLLWLLAASLGPENSYHGVNHPGDRLNKSRQVSSRVWWMRECARLEFYSIPSSRHLGRAGPPDIAYRTASPNIATNATGRNLTVP